jgi:hypothetical protein
VVELLRRPGADLPRSRENRHDSFGGHFWRSFCDSC